MLGPIAFQEKSLKRKLWSKQRELCSAIATHASVSVKGCHGSGKTYLIAGYVPYWLLTDPEAICITVAPTLRQVKLMWNEISSAIAAMNTRVPEPSTTAWQLSDKNYAQGVSSSKGVNAQGFHGKRVLIIADEAIGIAPDLWDAIDGIRMSGDVRIVKLCNPTVPSGPVFEDFTRLRGRQGHKCITISAFDTPNLEGLTMEALLKLPEDQLDLAPFPQLTRRRAVLELYHKWGPTNPRFVSRVLGEFPTQADNSVFSLEWIEKAGLPWDEEEFRKDLTKYRDRLFIQIGLDIAGPGDDETSVCARLGTYVLAQDAWVKPDPLQEVFTFISRLMSRFPGVPIVIMADVVGIGYHFARSIARQGFDVREFRAGSAAVDPIMFRNAKAESYWRLRECMKAGEVKGILDEDTRAQLSDVRYRELINAKIEIEHKDEVRARGSSSPDRAEAVVMAFARIVPKETTTVFQGTLHQQNY